MQRKRSFRTPDFQLLEQRAGLHFEFRAVAPTEVDALVQAGQIDLFPTAKTPRREAVLYLTRPFRTVSWVFVRRREAPLISNLRALKGQRVAIIKGIAFLERLADAHPDIRFWRAANPLHLLQAVSSDVVEAGLLEVSMAGYHFRRHRLNNLKIAGVSEYADLPIVLAVRPEWPELGRILDKAIASITPEEAEAITRAWMPVRFEYAADWTRVWQWSVGIGGAAGLLLLLTLLWNQRMAREIAERKHAQAQLSAALQAKTALLQEVHHRTRNNMQIMSMLLDFQARQVEETHVRHCFKDIRNRIDSMALVHQQLHRDDLTIVNFQDYLEELASMLAARYPGAAERIRFHFDTEPILITIDPAVPLGLLLYEVISNALEHAFPDGRAGDLHISFHTTPTGERELRVRDTGVGLPAEFDPETARSVGVQLIRILVWQLQGTVRFQRHNPGAEVIIRFKEPQYEKRI